MALVKISMVYVVLCRGGERPGEHAVAAAAGRGREGEDRGRLHLVAPLDQVDAQAGVGADRVALIEVVDAAVDAHAVDPTEGDRVGRTGGGTTDRDLLPAVTSWMPSPALPRLAVPPASVPMRFPWIRLPFAPVNRPRG